MAWKQWLPRLVTWWHGVCLGFPLGFAVAVGMIDPGGAWNLIILMAFGFGMFLATLPDAVGQFVAGVRRYRAVSTPPRDAAPGDRAGWHVGGRK